LTGLPRKNYSPTPNYLLGGLIKKSIAKHSDHNKLSDWQNWYAALSPTIRNSHDLTFINHILRKDLVSVGSGSWSNTPLPKPEPEIKPYLELVRTLQNVPHDQPAEARIAAAIRA